MVEIRTEITKAEYDQIQATNKFSDDFLKKHISAAVMMGYGIYGMKACEEDGKYFLWYERGDSCD